MTDTLPPTAPDSFLVLHIVRLIPGQPDKETGLSVITGTEGDAPDYQFTYRDNDLEGAVHVFERPGAEYAGDPKTNYDSLRTLLTADQLAPLPNEIARFETYGENRDKPLTPQEAPFPLVPPDPYHTQSGFFLYSGSLLPGSSPPLHRCLATSPDGPKPEMAIGKALFEFTRETHRHRLPLFLAYQGQAAKVRFLTDDFNKEHPRIRKEWEAAAAFLNVREEESLDLGKLSAHQDALVKLKYKLQRQLNTLSVAEFHLRSLQPAQDPADREASRDHLFSAELRRVQSLRASLQTELDYIEPMLERTAHVLQRLSIRAQEKSNRIAEQAERQDARRAELREYFGVFLASAGTFWGTMQTTAEFKGVDNADLWWRWPLVWGMGAVAFSGALWAFHRHEPDRSDFARDAAGDEEWETAKRKSRHLLLLAKSVLVGTATLYLGAAVVAHPVRSWNPPTFGSLWAAITSSFFSLWASPYFWAILAAGVVCGIFWKSADRGRSEDQDVAKAEQKTAGQSAAPTETQPENAAESVRPPTAAHDSAADSTSVSLLNGNGTPPAGTTTPPQTVAAARQRQG